MEQSISIHAPLAGRDGGGSNGPHKKKISIHAPLAGRDGREQRHDPQVAHFNPRAPCGARPRCAAVGTRSFRFQSTRPLRGATVTITPTRHVRAAFQSTRPLRGATSVGVRVIRPRNYFNPRAPCGARQNTAGITAMHEWNFNPRAPCGARRPRRRFLWQDQGEFQSTRPLRGATSNHLGEELTNLNFNPRAPCGARLITWMGQLLDFYISIHAPLAGRDGYWL